MKKMALIMTAMLLLPIQNLEWVFAEVSTVYEAEAGTRSGYAAIEPLETASGGAVVKNIGGPNTDIGSVRFNVYAPSNGTYRISINYIQRGTKPFRVKVNDGAPADVPLDSGGAGKSFIKTISAALAEGDNTVKVYSDRELAIDLDCISVNTVKRPFNGGMEQSAAVYYGTAADRRCYGAEDGYVVTGLGPNGSADFNITAPQAGTYTLKIWYSSAAYKGLDIVLDSKFLDTIFCPITGEDYNIGCVEKKLTLSQGSHIIRFTNAVSSAPDIDKIQLTKADDPAPGAAPIGGIEVFSNPSVRVEYNMSTGKANVFFNNIMRVRDMQSVAKIDGANMVVKSSDYSSRSVTATDLDDGCGAGKVYTVTSKGQNLPDMLQSFYIYDNLPYIFVKVELCSSSGVSSNFMSPITAAGDNCINIGVKNDVRSLFVPFDNDNWVRYGGDPVNGQHTSYWVSAVYDNTSRNAVIAGSVDHDTWKTGVSTYGNGNSVDFLGAFGGIWSAQYTYDYMPHGSISGQRISSPRFFLGYFDDWRVGMETYGNANSKNITKLSWNGPTPFGYNSWYAQGTSLSYDNSAAASDFIRQLQSNGFNDEGVAYINLDSYWDNMSDSELAAFVNKCKSNGQKAGIYWSHFVYWATDMSRYMGTFYGNSYRFADAALTDGCGGVVSMAKTNGSLPLDPTSDAMQARLRYYMEKFVSLGFEFLKIDFLNYASVEGVYHNPDIKTGMQAYNFAVSQFVRYVDTDNFFLSYSIAPLFPYQYAHSRRISCDVGGDIGSTEYMMNSLTYGWWEGGTIYQFLDADMITMAGTSNEAKSRYNSSVVTGGLMLLSDDYSKSGMQDRTRAITSNKEINDLARGRAPFKPVEGNTGSTACNMFILDTQSGKYLAVFNYSPAQTSRIDVNLQRIGLEPDKAYSFRDLWTGKVYDATGTFSVNIPPAQSTIYKVTQSLSRAVNIGQNYMTQLYKEDFDGSGTEGIITSRQYGWSCGGYGDGANYTQIYLGGFNGSNGNAARFSSTTWYKTNWLQLDLEQNGVFKKVASGKDFETAASEVNSYLSGNMCLSFKAAFGSSTQDAQYSDDFKSYVSIKNRDGVSFAVLLLQGYTLSLVALNADKTQNVAYVIADGRGLFDTWLNINFYIKPEQNTYMLTVNGQPVRTEHGDWIPASNSGRVGPAGPGSIGKVQSLETGHDWSSWWGYVWLDDIIVSSLVSSSPEYVTTEITGFKQTGNDCTVTANFSNNITQDINAMAIFALYSSKGSILGVKICNITLPPRSGRTVVETINSAAQAAYAKVFVWQDTIGIKPLSKS